MPTKYRLGNFLRTTPSGSTVPYDIVQYESYISYENSPPGSLYSKKAGGKRHYKTFNSCLHMKTTRPGSYLDPYTGATISGPFGHWVYSASSIIRDIALSYAYVELDFQSNNSFEIINFIFELDDTLAMFSRKFLSEISYGSLNWGVLPFISDMKSLIGTVQDIYSGVQDSFSKVLGKRISRRCPVEFVFYAFGIAFHVKGAVNYCGYLDGSLAIPDDPIKAFLVLLDEIGLHPDLRTVWDLIPFSFVADYFLPIGDSLESIHPRGWFHPTFRLSGGYSVQVEVSMYAQGFLTGDMGSAKLYYRSPSELTLPTRPPVSPKYKAPDFRQLFNTTYLFMTTRR